MDALALPNRKVSDLSKLRLVGGPNLPYSAGMLTPNGTDHGQSSNTRFPVFIRAGATEIRLVYAGFYDNGAAEQAMPNAVTFTASLEAPAGNLFGAVTAFGDPLMTLNPGGTIISDPIPIDIAANLLYVRHFVTAPAGGKYPTNVLFNNSTWAGSELQTISTVDGTQNMGFAYAANAYEFNFAHCAVIGRQLKRTAVILGDGDSIMQGTGSNTYLSRGWLMSIIDGTYATGNIGFPSNTVTNSTLSQNTKARLLYADWADAAVEGFGTNDFAGNAADATIRAARIERWSQFARRGLSVAACTVMPRATSTDGFATDTNQTPLTAWLAGGNVQLHNAWLRDGAPMTGTLAAGYVAAATGSTAAGVMRAGQPGHVLSAVFDPAAAVQSIAKIGVWQGGSITPDGIHPADGAIALISAAVSAPVLAWCSTLNLS